MGGTLSPRYNLAEAPEYTEQLVELGDPRFIDDAIQGLIWGIVTNPSQFDRPAPDTLPDIYLAKADSYVRVGGDPTTPWRIWFKLYEDEKRVELLWIEEAVEEYEEDSGEQ